MKPNFNFETKAKIVSLGDSKIFKDWQSALPYGQEITSTDHATIKILLMKTA